ncbi:MAG: DUF3857 domain-containing protein [Candidatus Krumholzibacteria bacterium]
MHASPFDYTGPRAERALSRRARIILAVLFLIGVLIALAIPKSAAATTEAGWRALWNNQLVAARKHFEQVLQNNKQDISAQRGLVIALFSRGNERAAIEALGKLSEMKQAETIDFLLAMWVYQLAVTSGADDKDFREMCKRFAERDAIDALDRRPIYAATINFALSTGDWKHARSLSEKLNRIDKWSILGPFDNTSGSGHARTHIDEAGMRNPQRRFRGKAGQEFEWLHPKVLDRGRTINFSNHFARSTAITAYAGCTITTKKAGVYVLSLTTDGAVSVLLDGDEILNDDVVSGHGEFHHFEVGLNAGRHNLLVKVSGNAQIEPSVAASLSALDGREAKDVRYAPLIPIGIATGVTQIRRRPLPVTQKTASMVAADTLDAQAAYWRLLHLWGFDQRVELRKFASEVKKRFPQSALLRYTAGRALMETGDRTRSRQLMRKAADLDPTLAQALTWRAADKMQRRMFTQSDSLLLAATRAAPGFITARLMLLNSYWERQLQDKAIPMAERLDKEYPEFAVPKEILGNYYESRGEKGRAKRYRREELRVMAKGANALAKVLRAFEKDDPGEAAKQFEVLHKIFPDSPLFLVYLASSKLRDGDAQKAIELSNRAADEFPYSYDALLMKAFIEDQLSAFEGKHKPTAIEYYERSLAVNPGDFETRDKLRELKGLRPVSEILPPPNLEAARQHELSAADYPGENACVLLDDNRRIVFADGTTYVEHAIIAKVFNDAGVEQFSSLNTGLNPLFTELVIKSARTIKPSGEEFEARSMLGEIAFQSLAPGDVVELHYGGSSWGVGKLNQEFWTSHMFQWSVPCRKSTYTLLVPKGTDFDAFIHNHSAVIKDPVYTHGGFESHTWVMKDVPGRRRELYAPSAQDVSPWLDVSSVKHWSDIVEWYSDLSEMPSKADPVVDAKAQGDYPGREDPA